jgi:AcrR family transcriptional regulator
MRKLGDQLGVEAMSLYEHVANKDDLLDGMVDSVFAEMPAEQWPHLVEFSRDHVLQPGYDDRQELEWGLHPVLDGLQRALQES